MTDEEQKAIDNFKKLDFFEYDWQIRDEDFESREDMLSYAEKMQEIILNLIEKYQEEIYDFKTENKIMKRIIKENKLWETLLNDNEFIKYLYEEN